MRRSIEGGVYQRAAFLGEIRKVTKDITMQSIECLYQRNIRNSSNGPHMYFSRCPGIVLHKTNKRVCSYEID